MRQCVEKEEEVESEKMGKKKGSGGVCWKWSWSVDNGGRKKMKENREGKKWKVFGRVWELGGENMGKIGRASCRERV